MKLALNFSKDLRQGFQLALVGWTEVIHTQLHEIPAA
jgi:hypothetical protein